MQLRWTSLSKRWWNAPAGDKGQCYDVYRNRGGAGYELKFYDGVNVPVKLGVHFSYDDATQVAQRHHEVGSVIWGSVCRDPIALVILPWKRGFTLARRNRDGRLFGCRDVFAQKSFPADCLAAWVTTERERGLSIEDNAGVLEELSAQGASL